MSERETAGFDGDVTDNRAGANKVAAAQAPKRDSLLRLVVGVVVVAALYLGRDVLVPITLALLLSFVLSPLVSLIRRIGLWRGPSVVLAMLLAIGVLGAGATLIGEQAAQLAVNAPAYAQTIERKVSGVQAFATARLASMTKLLGDRPRRLSHAQRREPVLTTSTGQRLVPVEVHEPAPTPLEMTRSILAPVIAPLETAIIVLVVAVFVLLQKEDLRDRFIRLFGSTDLHRTTLAIDDAGARLSRYFVSQLAVNASFGAIIGAGLWFIGIPQPALWGVLAGLLRFVPYIGAFISAIAPLGLAAAIDPGWTSALWTVALFAVVEPVIGYVVEPALYGHSTGLSPISVVVAAIFWTWIWGPIGLILSTPLTLCLVVLGRHVRSLEFFDVLLGDRPALTAVETFYQRILTDNIDDALEQAEAFLADRPIVDYFDEIAIPGLRLAADDRARGTLGSDQVQRIRHSIDLLTQEAVDLAKPVEKSPRPADTELAVACIAGGGPFDESVAAMLVVLLTRQGVAARVVSNSAVIRDTIDRLDLDGARDVALIYLDMNAALSPLRYLVRRLRTRKTSLRIVAGLSDRAEGIVADRQLQEAVGADLYAALLSDAVTACLQDAEHKKLERLMEFDTQP